MNDELLNRVKPKVNKDGLITNLSHIIDNLGSIDDEEFLKDYLDSLIKFNCTNKLDNISYEALKLNIENRLKTIDNNKTTNVYLLKELKRSNKELDKISVIKNNGTDYIKYIDKNNNINLIEIDDNKALFNYLEEHQTFKDNGKSSDLINYFLSLPHKTVDIKSLNKKADVKEIVDTPNKSISVISVIEFTTLLSKLYKGIKISNQETEQMNMFTVTALDEMENETIDFDHQQALDCYMQYLEELKENGGASNVK